MYYNHNTVVYLDGKWIKASEAQTSLYDQTLHYGNGVFEGDVSLENNGGFSSIKYISDSSRTLNAKHFSAFISKTL